MKRRIISLLLSIALGAAVLVAPLAFLNFGEEKTVKAEDYTVFYPQAGSNFRLSQVQNVAYSGKDTIISLFNLVRAFWQPYEIALSGNGVNGGANSMLSAATNGVYIDLIFGRGFGYTDNPQTDPGSGESYADGYIYTMYITYSYTATNSTPCITVSFTGDQGIPLLMVNYYSDTNYGMGGVEVQTTNQFPDQDMYLLGFQAYVMVMDSGFTGTKFCIPTDFRLSNSSSSSSTDVRTLTNFVYTYLAFDLSWSTSYTGGSSSGGGSSGGSSGSTEGSIAAYNRGYEAGYSKGMEDGRSDGYNEGYDKGKTEGYDTGYASGVVDGKKQNQIVGDTTFFSSAKIKTLNYNDGSSNSNVPSVIDWSPVYDDFGALDFDHFKNISSLNFTNLKSALIEVSFKTFDFFVDNLTLRFDYPSYLSNIRLYGVTGTSVTGKVSEEGFVYLADDVKASTYKTNKMIFLITAEGLENVHLMKFMPNDNASYQYGYIEGYDRATVIEGKKEYNRGVNEGATITSSWLSTFFSGFSTILDTTLFGSIKLWHLVSFPLLLGAIFLVFKFIK